MPSLPLACWRQGMTRGPAPSSSPLTSPSRPADWDDVRAFWQEVATIASGGKVTLGDQLIRVIGDAAYKLGTEHVTAMVHAMQLHVARGGRPCLPRFVLGACAAFAGFGPPSCRSVLSPPAGRSQNVSKKEPHRSISTMPTSRA